MLDSNFQNKSCGFGEDLVSYLYDEIGKNEKTKFEKHLSSCQTCEKELASFGFVRSSINAWKAEDFANISLPKIEIEYDEIETPSQVVETVKTGWFEGLAGIFNGFPTRANATAAFAILAICVVIGLIALNYTETEEVVKSPNPEPVKEIKTVKEQVVSPQDEVIATKQEVEEVPESETISENKTYKPEIVSKTEIKKKSQKRRVTKKQNQTLASNTKRDKKIVDYKKPNEQMTANNSDTSKYKNNFNDQEVLRLSNLVEEDVEEDEMIRLTDLFDEVGDDK